MQPSSVGGPQIGEVVEGRYRLDQLIARGGFGAVYRATQLNMGRVVALKLLHPALFAAEGAHERFCREAELAQQLKHPNTVRVYDFGRASSGLPFIVWEYLEGQALDTLIDREGPQPPARVVRVASQVLKALMEAHALGIVHRDIKPANLFILDFPGEPDFVKVLDFGVAKTLLENGPALTAGTLPVGTPRYMAPEQVKSEQVTPATDLFALGLVMSEMLTGQPVFDARSLAELFTIQASEAPVPISEPVSQSELGRVIWRATQKRASQRYHSAEQMLSDLASVAPSGAVLFSQPRPPASSGPVTTLPAVTPGHQGASYPPVPSATMPVSSGGAWASAASDPPPRAAAAPSRAWIWLVASALVVLGGGVVVVAGALLFINRETGGVASTAGGPISLDGVGAETAVARIKPLGWHASDPPVLNLEGGYQTKIVRIERGSQTGVINIHRFDDQTNADNHARSLAAQGSQVLQDRTTLLEVSVGNAADGDRILIAIVRPPKGRLPARRHARQ